MATECQVCLGVAAGGRIRITDESALLMLDLLDERRRADTIERRLFIDTGKLEALRAVNAELKVIDRQVEEIQRTQREMGWLHGQPQRSHP